MLLQDYISNQITFDLSGVTPKLVVHDNSAYPAGVAEVLKAWIKVTQPDKKTVEYGSVNSPAISHDGIGLNNYEIDLRTASDNKVQRGTYKVEYYVLHGGYLTQLTRTFEFNYKEVTLNLEEQFDVFTPVLKYEDKTNYAVTLYDIISQYTGWTAQVGSVGVVAGSSAIFDLVYALNYYDAAYTINFSKQVTYQHQTYDYLFVSDSFAKTINTAAKTPPTPSQLLTYLNAIKQRFVSAKGTCEPYQKYIKAYIRATAILYHMSKRICAGDTVGVEDYVQEFMDIYYDYDGVIYVHTNAPIAPYAPGDCSGGESVPAHILNITTTQINQWNAAYSAIPPKDIELIVGVDAEAPAAGTATYTNALITGWNVRFYLNRLRQTTRADYAAGDIYYSKPYASNALNLHNGNFGQGDLIQIELYRSLEDIVGG